MKHSYVYFLIFFLLIGACTPQKHVKGGVVKASHTEFGVELPSEIWQQQNYSGLDLFFVHTQFNATIFVRSECERFRDSPLSALTSQLLVGLSDIKFNSQDLIPLSNREALVSDISAKLDGVPRWLRVMVMRKNRCVYDVVLSAEKESDELKKDFDTLVKSFWAEADL